SGREHVTTDERWIDRERQRRIAKPGMRADLGVRVAPRSEGGSILRFDGRVVVDERVRAYGGLRPFATEPRGDRLLVALVAAVIADEHDVAKAGCAKAPRRVLEQALERLRRDRKGAREAHVRRRR